MKFEVYVHANWGISSPSRVICKDYKEMMKVYNSTKLRGTGNVVCVEAKENGIRVMRKRIKLKD